MNDKGGKQLVDPTAAQQAVTVIITPDHVAVMDPPVPLLRPLFDSRKRKFVPEGPLGYQEVEEEMALCTFDNKDRLAFPAGLLPRVRRVLREHGYWVSVDDQRYRSSALQVDANVLASEEGKNRSLLQAVRSHRLGRIEVGDEQEVLTNLMLIARLFPQASIAVAVPTREQARKLCRDLEDGLGEEVALALSGVRRSSRRLLVGTFQSVPRQEKYDILILPFAEESTGETACAMVTGITYQRCYGLIRPQRRTDRLGQLRLEQMCGEIIHRIQRPRVPVRVLMLPMDGEEISSSSNPLERKRTLYWQNQHRNEHVARVARAVYAQDRAALKDLGLRNRDISAILQCNPSRIRLLVETPEHARELLALLPGWRAGILNLSGDTGMSLGSPIIMTAVYADTLDIEADLIIRATGTEWALRVKNFPPRISENTPPEVVVLDFADSHHPAAREDTRRRVEEYRRRGMAVRLLQPGAP
jgi:hypothetical protein